MILQGKLYAESPIYRGNGRKTLFTRDGDGTQRLVSLAGEIAGTAESLMDAFIGESRDGKNIGLLNRLWRRLYDAPLPPGLITQVECRLRQECYPRDHFFDLRMGLRLDEDRWAAEANANYKMETLFRNAIFDLTLTVDDRVLQQNGNAARLYYLLQELREGRFWFGAGKSKGLGRCRLEMDWPQEKIETPPRLYPGCNHLRLTLTFNATNPVLVGWNWGKVEPETPSFAAIEGRVLVGAMKSLPEPIRTRLEMTLSGPILSPEDWKNKLAGYLPRVMAIWLREQFSGEIETWRLSKSAVDKLSKGKMPPSKKTLDAIRPLCDQIFASKAAAEAALMEATGGKANLVQQLLKGLEARREATSQLDAALWQQASEILQIDETWRERIEAVIQDEAALTALLAEATHRMLPQLYEQVDQQIRLLQSDTWVDAEIANREAHLLIKTMLLEGKISEAQWQDRNQPPAGVNIQAWRSFLEEHSRVRFQHLLHPGNLRKSITNDRNYIAFLTAFRNRTRQELAQPYHIDFRAGGPANREISQKYGKPYDTVFMRMLCWSPASQEGAWEIYIPGSTLKGAFRKRASQVLKTLWGESEKTTKILDRLFGAQRQRGMVLFSDAYLLDPQVPERAWCCMDGVRMDPATGQPIETAKRDYLFGYGDQLVFQLRLDISDIDESDLEALALLAHLIQDFQNGDIPIGGEKTSGFGWVKASISQLEWLTADPQGIGIKLFEQPVQYTPHGIWHRLELTGQAAAAALRLIQPLAPTMKIETVPPRTRQGFVSHRAFGGYSGLLAIEAEILTPTNVRESGQPSFTMMLDGGPVNGWDFFALTAPKVELRDTSKTYAIPSRSLKGMLRHLYAIASDSREPSTDLSHLNPADSLFGWVGSGPNQAIMGRLSFSFGMFDAEPPELAWFQVPYPYGRWKYVDGEWQSASDRMTPTQKHLIEKTWRLFPHAPLAPLVKRLDRFAPDTIQASYFRAILPGARAHLTIRFWNLEEQELQRLIWCVALEPGLAHKIGNNRYLGFGSIRLRILPDSFLVNWARRYGTLEQEWRQPLRVDEWLRTDVIRHYDQLRRLLNAQQL